MKQQYEVKHYGELGAGLETVEILHTTGDNAARQYVGRLALRICGPVDLARAGVSEWNERYLTTAEPSEFNAAGYRHVRIA